MKLDEFIENLCLGELSNLYIGLQGQVEIHPQNKAKLINYINQGLVALYSRFVLLKKELIVIGSDSISIYHLESKYSISSGSAKVKYIDDTCCETFRDDLIKIIAVHNSDGREFPLNQKKDLESLHTPSWNSLQIPHAIEGQPYFVMYQAKPVKISASPDGCVDLNIPPLMIEALYNFVASKVYSHMNGDNNKASATEYMSIFDSKCLQLQVNDLGSESETQYNTKAEMRGYV